MGRKITIEVTDDDIFDGIKSSCHSCPIALAATRIDVARIISVNSTSMAVRNTYSRHGDFILLPIEAIDFIAAFDSNQPVEPFSFEIEVPDVIE